MIVVNPLTLTHSIYLINGKKNDKNKQTGGLVLKTDQEANRLICLDFRNNFIDQISRCE